jgi:hypothetical protein
MQDIYRDNRLSGKSNFVTADSIIHPYFCFVNRVLIDTIKEIAIPNMRNMLQSMLTVAINDYRTVEDGEVRSDIEANIAYIAIGLELLDPGKSLKLPGNASTLAREELMLIRTRRKAKSFIFGTEQNYAYFEPVGIYRHDRNLEDFYQAKEWLSMRFPVTDITVEEGEDKQSNSFRRSVLLYRSLSLANVLGRPTMQSWQTVCKVLQLLGSEPAYMRGKFLLPSDYQTVLLNDNTDLKVTLKRLSEPFFRTKLMLTLRKAQPVSLGAASIFDLEDSEGRDGAIASFHLFPQACDPELPWIREEAGNYSEQAEGLPEFPLSLVILNSWGAGQASNLLLANQAKIDRKVPKSVITLNRLTTQRLPGGTSKTIDDRRWQILSTLFNMPANSTPAVFRSECWMDRHMETAIAGWVDSIAAVAPQEAPDTNKSATSANSIPKTTGKRTFQYHYLDPVPDLYAKIGQDAQYLKSTVNTLGLNNSNYNKHFDDFIRLSNRLESIAKSEIKSMKLSTDDRMLLANIDLILSKISPPTPVTYSVPSFNHDKEPGSNNQVTEIHNGINFGIGRPALLYVILQNGTRATLARGAVYSFYEVNGKPIKAEQWARKLAFNSILPPPWTKLFDVIQDPSMLRTKQIKSTKKH